MQGITIYDSAEWIALQHYLFLLRPELISVTDSFIASSRFKCIIPYAIQWTIFLQRPLDGEIFAAILIDLYKDI
jgi:hypothetical protein